MPLLSFYYLSRKEHPWLYSIDHFPTDWLELKRFLIDAMIKLNRERSVTSGIIVLYRHLPGRAVPRFNRPYSDSLVPYKREFEAAFKVASFNPAMGDIDIAEAEFNYTLFNMREDYWWMERGIRWRIPSVIPREQMVGFGSARSLIMEPSIMRYITYSRTPRLMYSSGNEEGKPRQVGYAKSAEDPGEGLYFRVIEKRLSLHKERE